MSDDVVPDLCLFVWQQGVGGKRHVCSRRNYPNHHHGCCCGILLTAHLASSIQAAKARREDSAGEGDVAA